MTYERFETVVLTHGVACADPPMRNYIRTNAAARFLASRSARTSYYPTVSRETYCTKGASPT